jgi:DNA damage-binding protein 1
MIQVTPKRAVLLDFQISLGEYIQVGQGWTPERMADNPLWDHLNWKGREVVAASINPSQVALALSGSILVLLNLSANDEFNVVRFVV